MKKVIFTLLVLIGLVLISKPALAYTPNNGDLVKVSNNPAVYFIDANGYRHLFSTRATFFSWYKGSWSDQNIKTISEYELSSLPIGKNVTMRPGYSLIRFDNSLKMYAVLPSGKICKAPAHYGNFQYNRAAIVPASFESDYYNDNICDITADQKLPDGTLLRYSGSNDVYYVQNGQRRRVTETGFNENNFRWDSVIENVSWSMSYPEGNVIYNRESNIYSIGYNFNNSYYGYGCTENWSCNSWGSCSGGSQYRTCWDNNNCNTTYSKPIISQTCQTCSENWTCGAWSSCAYNKQYRTCWDNNNCRTTYSKPAESQTCYSCNENCSCTAWSICASGNQYRSCLDTNRCNTARNKPTESQTCR